MNNIKIPEDYRPGEVVGFLRKSSYGLVLKNNKTTVSVVVLATGKDGILIPTCQAKRWQHQAIYRYCGLPNTLQIWAEGALGL